MTGVGPALLCLLGLLVNCGLPSEAALGEAYVGPISVPIRRELTKRESVVATLNHGDHVRILEIRRRYLRVRSDGGQEGWLDSSQLISREQMNAIRAQTERALRMPSEGEAIVFEALNIHPEPDRQSVAFAKISEGARVSVLAHRLAPKVMGRPPVPSFITARPAPPAHRAKKDKQTRLSLKPPLPPPPKPPANWQDLSVERFRSNATTAERNHPASAAEARRHAEPAAQPVVYEDWTLIRTADKRAGWVLSRNLSMAIPDEVAQYAEGHRITSYFDLGAVQDEEKGLKHNWLWTTLSGAKSYDFDAFRVFLWNRKRHRYETSYRRRDLEGYYPVRMDAPDPNSLTRTFALITREPAGGYWQTRYLFDGVLTHMVSREGYRPDHGAGDGSQSAPGEKTDSTAHARGWFERHWQTLRRRLSRH